jgi:hypothetical protein
MKSIRITPNNIASSHSPVVINHAPTININVQTTTNTVSSADEGDFDSVFGDEGDESDEDLFGNTISQAGKAARVSAADALSRIQSFDFTL